MRPINGKFHIENDQIIKTTNGEPIPLEEPVFLLRGRDRLAVAALLAYRDWHFEKINGEIARFEQFAKDYPNRMKQPSVTKGK